MITATISHDMRTPLNAILGMGKSLERYTKEEPGKRYHKILMSSANLLLYLVNDILDLFKLRNGKFTKTEVYASLRKELEDLLEIFSV